MSAKHIDQIFQVVCVVRDLDVTLENWKKHVEFDESSIKLYSSEEMEKNGKKSTCVYKGRVVDMPFKAARFNLGGMDMKFVQPLNESGDVYSDELKAKGQGFHHLSIYLPDSEMAAETCRKWGYEPLAEETIDDKTYLLFDLRDKMGLMFEPWDHIVGPCGPRDENGKTI